MTKRVATQTQRAGAGSALFWLLLSAWILILGLAAGAAVGLAQIYRSERILAGVEALGRDLSAKTPDEAALLLRTEWATRRIILETPEQSWTLTPEQVGIVLDAEGMANAAQAQGRGELTPDRLLALTQRLIETAGLLPLDTPRITVQTLWRFDRETATRTLRTLAGQVDVAVQNANVRVVEARIETTPAVTGQALDIAALLARLETYPWAAALADPAAPSPRLDLPVVPQPPAITDVSALVAEVQPLLAAPITLRLYDAVRDERATWDAQPDELGNWLTFTISGTVEGNKSLTWAVDEEAVAAFVQTQNARFGNERYVDLRAAVPALAEAFSSRKPEVALRVSYGEREHVVKAGETLSSIAFNYGMPYPWIQAANPGKGDAIFVGDRLRIPSADALLPLPVVENKRIIVRLTDQRVQVYENGQLKWDWLASTGMADSPTSPGVFQIQSHEELAYAGIWDLYMPWFMGIYRVAPDQAFMNGFHGFPSRDRRQFLWERNLGGPITYGCILVSTTNAKLLYDWAEKGVVVEIRP